MDGNHQLNIGVCANALVEVVTALIFLLCTGLTPSAAEVQYRDGAQWYRHIRATDPSRPSAPLRQDNITDEEVREVQLAALEVYPDVIVNISGVTTGCGCEEGPACTAQVWIALHRGSGTHRQTCYRHGCRTTRALQSSRGNSRSRHPGLCPRGRTGDRRARRHRR